MRKDEIDNLLKMFKKGFFSTINDVIQRGEKIEFDIYSIRYIKFIEKYSNKKIKSFDKNEIDSVFRCIMKDIEDSNYDYFKQLISYGNQELLDLMCYSSKCDDIKEFIKSRKQISLNNLFRITNLIIATRDPDYIKTCIKDKEKFGFNSVRLTNLIMATGDPDYIKTCIDDRDNFGFSREEVIELIKATGDEKYINDCINKFRFCSSELTDLISYLNVEDIKICIDNRKKLRLDTSEIQMLLESMGCTEYTKTCFKKREELGLKKYKRDVKFLMRSRVFTKECIKEREELGLDSDILKELIISIGEPEYTKECIKKRELLGLSSENITDLILSTGDLDFIKECENNAEELNMKPEEAKQLAMFTQKTQILLPSNMAISIGIISKGQLFNKIIRDMLNEKNWTIQDLCWSGMVTNAMSPILIEDTENSSNEIKSVCAILNGIGQTINENYGSGKIKIGASYLTSENDWNNFRQIIRNYEEISTIMNEGADIHLEYGENNIECSLCANLNPNTLIENINFFGGIVRSAHELTEIQKKPEKERTEEERKKLESFKKIQTKSDAEIMSRSLSDEEIILRALIDLCVIPQQRHIYLRRCPYIKDSISVDQIARKILGESRGISGVDYQQGATQIEAELKREDWNQGLGQEGN